MDRIERCFWCGRPKDINIKETDENLDTLKNSIIKNYIPCDRCKEEIADKIHVIGVTEEPIVPNMFPISKDDNMTLYPTGSMFAAGEDMIKDMLSDQQDLLENVLNEKVLLLPDKDVTDIIHQIIEYEENNNIQQEANYVNNILNNIIDNPEE